MNKIFILIFLLALAQPSFPQIHTIIEINNQRISTHVKQNITLDQKYDQKIKNFVELQIKSFILPQNPIWYMLPDNFGDEYLNVLNDILYYEDKMVLEINGKNWNKIPVFLKNRIIEEKTIDLYGVKEFKFSYLQSNLLTNYLGEKIKCSNNYCQVESLLSDFTAKWYGKFSKREGPNCFHSSLASISITPLPVEELSDKEFLCNIKNSFAIVIDNPTLGDLILFTDENDMYVHSAVYIGKLDNPKADIVFTKNGRNISRYFFTSIKQLQTKTYPNTKTQIFRKINFNDELNIYHQCKQKGETLW